jgi:hypothetical protein
VGKTSSDGSNKRGSRKSQSPMTQNIGDTQFTTWNRDQAHSNRRANQLMDNMQEASVKMFDQKYSK